MDKKKKRQRDVAMPRDDYFMGLAGVAAAQSRSPDPHGAVFVAVNGDWTCGADTMPGIASDLAPWDDDLAVHAEAEALARTTNRQGGTLYCTRCPCGVCTSLAVHLGIKRVVYLSGTLSEKTQEVARLTYLQIEEFRGDMNWLRDHIRSLNARGLFK